MNLKNKFRKYLKPKYSLKLVNILLILAMLLTSLPMATQAATPERRGQVDPCIAGLSNDGDPVQDDPEPELSTLYLPIIVQTTNLFRSAANLLGLPQGPAQVARELSYEVGKMYTYDYVVEVVSTSHQRTVEGEGETGNNTTIVKMDADIAIESQNDDGSFKGMIVLNNPSICSTDGENQDIADTDEFSAELQKPLRFTQAATGQITSVQIPEGSNITATNMQKGVVNALQMTLQTENNYTVEEVGGQGKYNVVYTLVEADGNLSINKVYDQESFKEQNRQGDETNSFTLDTSLNATLDSAQGILTSVMGNETITTGDGVEDPDGSNAGFAGATAWTTIETKTKLTFDSIKEASSIRAAALNLVYQEDGLGANFDSNYESHQLSEIDVETLNLDEEVQALVDTPDDLDLFLRILNLISLDPNTAVLEVVAAKLAANADNDVVSTILIDVLVEVGTPYAQDILSGILGNDTVHAAGLSATMSVTTTEHALIGLVLIDSPTITTANTVQALGRQEGSELQETAISVLGATIDKLANNGDEETSSTLTEELIAGLRNAATEEDLELHIGALGNASQPGTLDEIAQYITDTLTLADGTEITETTGIQFAALTATRNFADEEAEGILVAALTDEDALLTFRLTAFDALSGRENLSEAALGALQDNASLGSTGTNGEGSEFEEDGSVIAAGADATDTDVSRDWNKRFGNSKLGIELPGRFSAAAPPSWENWFYLYAQQKADALVWGKTINLVTGTARFSHHPPRAPHKFGVYLDLLDYRIRKKYEQQSSCALTRNANLWRGSREFGFNYSIPILAIISINLEIKLGATIYLDYRLDANVCNPATMRGSLAIVPGGYATATASASLSLWLVRGGVGVTAKILDTKFILSLGLTANTTIPSARFCVSVRIELQAISGKIYAFVDRRKRILWGSWKRLWTGNLAEFGSPRYTIPLWNNCWP